MKYFGGHGAAIAQAYNHIIIPLANERDKRTQVIWGIRDFEHRFGRRPEGMWLPETAVDVATLEVLAEYEIKFTILAPRQAKRIRKLGGTKWQEVKNEQIDTAQAYVCNLPSGKTISLFFFNNEISEEVAYGGLLNSGDSFAQRLTKSFSQDNAKSQLVSIATDGESYGHHHRYGDMALAYCLHNIESGDVAELTVYGEFLEKRPPEWEVEIVENTSWSCVHGVERWRDNCGCSAGRYPSGAQQWRKPLREALDWLRDSLVQVYEEMMRPYVSHPWQVRDDYISLILDRSFDNVQGFISRHAGPDLSEDQKVTFLKMLEMQRNALLMYTSCGWFFDDISGIETVQVLEYAARAIQLYRDIRENKLEQGLIDILEKAPANYKAVANGKEVYQKLVGPTDIDLNRVGAHFAISSLFQDYPAEQDIYCYSTRTQVYDRMDAGIQKLAIGRTTIQSNIVMQKYPVDFAVMHLGEQNIFGAVTARMPDDKFEEMRNGIKDAFTDGNTTEVIRLMDVCFGGNDYSLWHLFKDEQRRILNELLATTWQEVEASFRHVYEHNYTIMNMMRSMRIPLPHALLTAAEFVINQDLKRLVRQDEVDIVRLRSIVQECSRLSIKLDESKLRFEVSRKISSLMTDLEQKSRDADLVETIGTMLQILLQIIDQLDLQVAQNVFFGIARDEYSGMKSAANKGDDAAAKWVGHFEKLAEYLGVKVE
jgi:hypothetical protein